MTTPIFKPPSFFYTIPKPSRFLHRWESIWRFQHRSSPLDANPILDEYNLPVQGKLYRSNGVGRSDWLALQTKQGKVLLKKYKHTVTAPTIRHEHSILEYLSQINFPAPRLLTTTSGDTLLNYKNNYYALFEYLDGYFQYHHHLHFPGQARYFINLAGQTLAILHRELEHFNPEGYNPEGFKSRIGERWRDLAWYLDRLEECQSHLSSGVTRGDDPVYKMVEEKANWLKDTLFILDKRLKEASLPRYLIHNDYGAHNLFFKRDAPIVILDFELASIDWRLTDLTKAMLFIAKNRFGINIKKMETFLRSYHKHNPISSQEMQFLPESWRYFVLRRLIVNWFRYCQKSDTQYAEKSEELMGLASWIQSNREQLRSLITPE